MVERTVIAVLPVLVFCLVACGPTTAQVNNSGHDPYLTGDHAAALQSYQEAQRRAPDSGEPYYNSGNALYRLEKYQDSLHDYDESLIRASDELRSRGFFNRGNASFQQQQYDQAVEAYKEVLRMNPGHLDAKHNLELALKQRPPEEQEGNQGEQQNQEEQDEQQEDEQEEQQPEEQEQDAPITEAQARQILESVGDSAQTLQERRQQQLVSPKPPSEFDW